MMQGSLLKKKTLDLSPAVHTRAKKEELGEFRKVYSLSKPHTVPFTIGAVCILLSFVLVRLTVLVALGQLPLLYLPTGTASGIILLMIGLYLMLSRRIYDCHISLWQYGFIYEKQQMIQVFR